MQRLEANEEAIEQSQKVAEGERAERKRLTKMLKTKTAELKEKVKEAGLPLKERVKKELERRLN